jgi:hypothetical protein
VDPAPVDPAPVDPVSVEPGAEAPDAPSAEAPTGSVPPPAEAPVDAGTPVEASAPPVPAVDGAAVVPAVTPDPTLGTPTAAGTLAAPADSCSSGTPTVDGVVVAAVTVAEVPIVAGLLAVGCAPSAPALPAALPVTTACAAVPADVQPVAAQQQWPEVTVVPDGVTRTPLQPAGTQRHPAYDSALATARGSIASTTSPPSAVSPGAAVAPTSVPPVPPPPPAPMSPVPPMPPPPPPVPVGGGSCGGTGVTSGQHTYGSGLPAVVLPWVAAVPPAGLPGRAPADVVSSTVTAVGDPSLSPD